MALIGKPSASAEPISFDLVESYITWLVLKMRSLTCEMEDLSMIKPRRLMGSLMRMGNGAARHRGLAGGSNAKIRGLCSVSRFR